MGGWYVVEGRWEGLLRVGRSHSHVDVACLILNAASALPHIVVALNWKSAHEGASCQSKKKHTSYLAVQTCSQVA